MNGISLLRTGLHFDHDIPFFELGSARVSRAGFGVSPKRTLALGFARRFPSSPIFTDSFRAIRVPKICEICGWHPYGQAASVAIFRIGAILLDV
ncbi:MAG: hypothetical protein DME87_04990 [Verrucomicrobia bacterium]|nr:MAG: hypothetical protein DME87_04990 [Verrucomicrobiota bacterium]